MLIIGSSTILNHITVLDSFPMHVAEELVDRLGRSNVNSTLDLVKGYQFSRKDSLCHINGKIQFFDDAIWSERGTSCFPEIDETILAGMTEFTASYNDDVAVYSHTMKEHLEHLRATLEQL